MASLYPLPSHFAREQAALQGSGVSSWADLAGLSDHDLRRLSSAGSGALERQLIKLRGQARLVTDLGLAPADAALLLYAGIASCRGLAQASPQQLLTQLGRLERALTGPASPRITAAQVRDWIRRAGQVPERGAGEAGRPTTGRSRK
ncbi:MAG: hypothetical protein RLZZ219_11 [Cyanobacteriota bacterium]